MTTAVPRTASTSASAATDASAFGTFFLPGPT